MKSQYLKNYITLKEPSKITYQSYLDRINTLFQSIQQTPEATSMIKLESQIHALKDFREMKVKDKQAIFKFFVQRNLKDFHFLRKNNSIELRLMKLTKTQLDDYQLDWKQIWEKLLATYPQIPTIRLYNELVDFLRIIKHLYVSDNALEVINYFMERHSIYTDNLSLYLSLFINNTRKTPKEVLNAYLDRIVQLYHINQLKASDLLIMYINAAKFKQNEVQPRIHQQLTKIVIYSLSTPSSQKKESIQPKFSTQTANIIFRIIGKCNELSVKLLQQVFQMTKLFIRPFQDSKKPLKLLCLFIMGFSQRISNQEIWRKKVNKLRAKEQKIKKKVIEKQSLPELSHEEPESAITEADKPQQKPVAKEEPSQEQEESSSDQDQNQNNDSDQEDQDNKVQKMITMDNELQENVPDQMTSNQKKIEKLQSLLNNQITEEIKEVVRKFINQHLEEIFYVNSKKMVSRILKECFKMFPETIPKSLEVLQKAGNIPQINEDGLISNIKHIAKYIFSKEMLQKGVFLENMMKLLARVKQHRRITDVWDIINSFIEKIPLLDEKDMEGIAAEDKQVFEKRYGQNHDRFYESYSQQIFQCAKRLFSQSQFYDSNTIHSSDKHILDLLNNSYPEFKKRIIQEMEQQIIQNNNKFLLSIFHSGARPSSKFEITLRQMIDHGSIESEDNLALQISVNTILSIDMGIEQIKKLIRRYSKKNNYKFLKQCMVSITNYVFTHEPVSSTLDYLDKKPEIKLKQEPQFKLVCDKMHHVFKYAFQLIDELELELTEFQENGLQKLKLDEVVLQVYSNKENTFKNMKVEKRKTINEILQILNIIVEYLFHQFEEYDPQKKTIQFKPAPYDRQSLLTHPKFRKIIDHLIYNQLFLHDPNIMHNLASIIENQVFFMYRQHIRLQKQILSKYIKKNNREQLPEESNLAYTNNIMIGKATVMHYSLLNNKYRDSVNIEDIKNQMSILVIAPGNDRSNAINKMLVKKTSQMSEEADRIILLLSKTVESRFYYEKVFNLLNDFLTSGYIFKAEQVLSIINSHIPLIQSQNIKIKEQSLKSLEKFYKNIHTKDLFGPVEHTLRQYAKKQKLELIWIIAVLIIIKEGQQDTCTDQFLSQLLEYLKLLEPLIRSEIRIVRRIAIFTYSFCFRRAKQSIKSIEYVQCPEVRYSKPKTTFDLYESGFLREQHIQMKNLANKEMLKKQSPYSTYRLKKKIQNAIFSQIESQVFDFVLKNPELGLEILKQFHIDMAASVEQVISMMHNKKHDLGEIAIRNLEGCYIYAKLYKLHYDRFEHHFGEAFFKYLFHKDAKYSDLSFFKATKEEVEKVLSNLQTYDNQTLLFIYLTDLLGAYTLHHQSLTEGTRLQVQAFVEKILQAMLYKGSGSIFKQLMLMIARCKYPEEIPFVIRYFKKLFDNKEKVSRVSQLLFSLCQDNYKLYMELMRFILVEKIEMNHNYITTLINSIVTLPEKYILTEQLIQKYGIIDLEAQLKAGRIEKLYHKNIYVPNTKEFNIFLINTLKQYLEVVNQPDQSKLQLKNELIKATYTITTSTINTFCQYYQTAQIISIMIELLEILFQLFESKMDLAIDYKQLEETVKNVVSNKYDSIDNFQKILTVIVDRTNKLPVKKQADIIKIISNRPGNFHFIDKEYYQEYVKKILQFSENSMIYKELLLSLSTTLSYVPLPHECIESLLSKCPEGHKLLLMQAYVMSTEDIASPYLQQIMGTSTTARRNMFCKEMLQLRGKKEYLDDEERYNQWKMIKQYSNPYHYHV